MTNNRFNMINLTINLYLSRKIKKHVLHICKFGNTEMNFLASKNLGGIGALIVLLEVFLEKVLPYGISTFGSLRVAGIIIILISLFNLANFYHSKNIFTNARLGAIGAIIGTIISIIVGVRIILQAQNFSPLLLLLFLITLSVIFTVATVFVRRSLNDLAVRSGVYLFAKVSHLLFIGAILTIIVIGLPIMWIAFLPLAIAFFKLKEPKHTPLHITETLLLTEQTAEPKDKTFFHTTRPDAFFHKFCPNCNTPVEPKDKFCTHCGKQT
jgi:uncharacterized membrane protein